SSFTNLESIFSLTVLVSLFLNLASLRFIHAKASQAEEKRGAQCWRPRSSHIAHWHAAKINALPQPRRPRLPAPPPRRAPCECRRPKPLRDPHPRPAKPHRPQSPPRLRAGAIPR